MSAMFNSSVGPARRKDPLTLTRKGRMLFLGIPALMVSAALLFALIAVLLGSFASPANASTGINALDMTDYAAAVTVLQGDSLWTIAAASDPSRDVREVVSEIVALNDLSSSVLQAGQQLYVPIHK